MVKFGGNSGEHLRQFMASIERLQEEKAAISDHIKEKFAEAKANGFDTKAMRKLLQEKKLTKAQREEEEAVLDTYRHALGMQGSFDFEPISMPSGAQADADIEEYIRIGEALGISKEIAIEVAKTGRPAA